VKLARLWQPRRLLFWQMVLFNVLSSVCTFAMRAYPLNTVGLLLVGFIALANVGFGLVAAWALLREPAPGEVDATAAGSRSSG
jgi:4-hydroxybenzoate polyprenyltransferase